MVEAALILFVFITFIVGTLDFGQYLYFHQSLTERARAALRYGGSISGTDSPFRMSLFTTIPLEQPTAPRL
jgi:Flp pilus assembly protein TadG